jgi:sulfate adenylyltransferase
MIKAHGGKLINKIVEGGKRERLQKNWRGMPSIILNNREISDLEMIATGAMSPLEGFMISDDYQSVLDLMRLDKGLPWTIPVTLAVKSGKGDEYKEGEDIALLDGGGNFLGVLHLAEKYTVDKEAEAEKVLLTKDEAHPGVQYLKTITNVYLGGEVSLVNRPKHTKFNNYRLDPKETRVLFKTKGWKTIVAFQTRNPIHRAHEYLQKCALETVDALLIHPLMGETKSDDIPADVRLACYEVLMANYYPKTRVAISVFPAAMRYAGPREAVFHALIRKNYGCSHLIVGRDHAGVGSYYGTYDAHYIFDQFDAELIDITPMFFDHAFFCKKCGNMASTKTCCHGSEEHIFLSGTKVRDMLNKGDVPPKEFTRPEVAQVLIDHYKSKQKEEK